LTEEIDSTKALIRHVLQETMGVGMEGRVDEVVTQLFQNDDFKKFIREHYKIEVDMSQGEDGSVFLSQTKRFKEDKLDDIWNRNIQFTDYAKDHNPRRVDMSKEVFMCRLSIALFREVGEMTDHVPWKWWGRGVWELTDENREKALEESIDLLHFWLEFIRCLGYNSTDIYRKYVEKNEENWRRFKEKDGWNQVIH